MELTNGLGEKFYGLFFSLRKTKKDFETIADEINDSPLRTALNGLSLNSAYFAGELKLQLQSLGIAPPRVAKTEVDDSPECSLETPDSESGSELYTICASNEHSLTAAYNSLITEQLPHNSLYEIMMYQLNALKNTFKLVQALNAGRFREYAV